MVIKDPALWEAWERETLLRQPADFRRNLRLLEAMTKRRVRSEL